MDDLLSILPGYTHVRRWAGVEETKLEAGWMEKLALSDVTRPWRHPRMFLHVSVFRRTVFLMVNALISQMLAFIYLGYEDEQDDNFYLQGAHVRCLGGGKTKGNSQVI